MLVRAMVTESTLDDLLKEMPKSEITSVVLCDIRNSGERFPMVMADISQDRYFDLVHAVQGTVVGEYSTLSSYDRLVVQSHKVTGETELETAQAEICFWSYKNEELL